MPPSSSRLLASMASDELVPLRHAGALPRHVVPMIVVLGAHILQRMVLEVVAGLLGNAGFAGQGLERPPGSRFVAHGIPPRSR